MSKQTEKRDDTGRTLELDRQDEPAMAQAGRQSGNRQDRGVELPAQIYSAHTGLSSTHRSGEDNYAGQASYRRQGWKWWPGLVALVAVLVVAGSVWLILGPMQPPPAALPGAIPATPPVEPPATVTATVSQRGIILAPTPELVSPPQPAAPPTPEPTRSFASNPVAIEDYNATVAAPPAETAVPTQPPTATKTAQSGPSSANAKPTSTVASPAPTVPATQLAATPASQAGQPVTTLAGTVASFEPGKGLIQLRLSNGQIVVVKIISATSITRQGQTTGASDIRPGEGLTAGVKLNSQGQYEANWISLGAIEKTRPIGDPGYPNEKQ